MSTECIVHKVTTGLRQGTESAHEYWIRSIAVGIERPARVQSNRLRLWHIRTSLGGRAGIA